MNSRGDLNDLLYGSILIFVAAFVIIFAYFLAGLMSTQMAAQGIPTEYMGHSMNALGFFNYGIILISIAFGVSTFILAFHIRTHPVYFVASLMSLAAMIYISSIMGNVMDKLIVTSALSTTGTTTFSTLFNFIRNFPAIMIVLGGVVMIGLYAKSRLNPI